MEYNIILTGLLGKKNSGLELRYIIKENQNDIWSSLL